MKQCRDNANKTQFIPLDAKNNINEWQRNKDYMHKWSSYIKMI